MENIKPKLNTRNILNSRRNLEEALIPEFKVILFLLPFSKTLN
jgi:hypothetical protein